MKTERHKIIYHPENVKFKTFSKAVADILKENPNKALKVKEIRSTLFRDKEFPRELLEEISSLSGVFSQMVNDSTCDPTIWGGVFDRPGKGRYRFIPDGYGQKEIKEKEEGEGENGGCAIAPFEMSLCGALTEMTENQEKMLKKLDFICEYLNERKQKKKKKPWGRG